jgi:glucan biosynthesis protein C
MFEGVYPKGNFSWHHLWFIVYLFVIALIFSMFIKAFRSEGFNKFMKMAEKLLSKPYALYLLILPLLISQILLRPWFPDETHDLVNDWANIAYYFIYFVYGFILLRSSVILETIKNQRRVNLFLTVIFTALMFSSPHIFSNEKTIDLWWDVSSLVLTWTCNMCVVGYGAKYLNKDSKLRKNANEAIFPVYLLHQPVIVVVAFIVTRLDVSVFIKSYSIIVLSITATILIYAFLIRPFNLTRIIFGLKMRPARKETEMKEINSLKLEGTERLIA